MADVPNIIEAHKIIKKLAMLNFMGARIPVSGQFNITTRKSYISGYWDEQILDFLQYGLPLDFDCSRNLHSTYENHA